LGWLLLAPDLSSKVLGSMLSLQSEGNMHFPASIAFLLLATTAFAQTGSQPGAHGARAIWEPPAWNVPQNVKATVPKEMVSTFRVSGYEITLEKTSIKDVEQRLGGIIGKKVMLLTPRNGSVSTEQMQRADGFSGWRTAKLMGVR